MIPYFIFLLYFPSIQRESPKLMQNIFWGEYIKDTPVEPEKVEIIFSSRSKILFISVYKFLIISFKF